MADASHDLCTHFAAELVFDDPVRLALAIARIAFPDLRPEPYLLQLDEMAQSLSPRVFDADPGGPRALALVQGMRLDLGMRGNSDQYYEAANSYLNVVMERRKGLPIMLSLIAVAIGERLGLRVSGVGTPGHFMVRYEDVEGIWFLDAFHGAVMLANDMPAYFMKLFGNSVLTMDDSYFAPFPAEAWAMRILNNLRAVFASDGKMEMLAQVLPMMLVLEPERHELWRELGVVEYRQGEMSKGARALRRYFYLIGYLPLSAPNSTLLMPVQAGAYQLDEQQQQLWNLLADIEAARTRWN